MLSSISSTVAAGPAMLVALIVPLVAVVFGLGALTGLRVKASTEVETSSRLAWWHRSA